MKQILNCTTGEIINRELTDEEIHQQQIDDVLEMERREAKQAQTEATAVAKATLLAKLGISEAEAKLLLS